MRKTKAQDEENSLETIPDRGEIRLDRCEWCDRPLDEGGVFHLAYYHPDGEITRENLCEPCRTYGPPRSSRRDRVEAAWTIRPQMNLLERIGWRLIERGRSK